jgi:hypothetical protein
VAAAAEETVEEAEVEVEVVVEVEVEDGFNETRVLQNKLLRLPGWFMIVNPNWSVDGPYRKRCPTLMPAYTLKINVGLARWMKFWGKFKRCILPLKWTRAL